MLSTMDTSGSVGSSSPSSVNPDPVVQKKLRERVRSENVAERQGPGGMRLHYLETHKAIELANDIFGYNGWSSTVLDITPDFVDQDNGKWSVGCSAIVRITHTSGNWHEDVGYGICEGERRKGQALEKAKKEAVSDARKRSLRVFGNALGNSLYDKEYLRDLKKCKHGMQAPGSSCSNTPHGPLRRPAVPPSQATGRPPPCNTMPSYSVASVHVPAPVPVSVPPQPPRPPPPSHPPPPPLPRSVVPNAEQDALFVAAVAAEDPKAEDKFGDSINWDLVPTV